MILFRPPFKGRRWNKRFSPWYVCHHNAHMAAPPFALADKRRRRRADFLGFFFAIRVDRRAPAPLLLNERD